MSAAPKPRPKYYDLNLAHLPPPGLLSQPVVKLALLGATWLYSHHFFAGIRYLLLDLHWGVEKAPARTSALVVFALGALMTLFVAWRLW